MREVLVTSFVEFHNCIEKYDQKFTVFRGVSNAEYELIPKIGRADMKFKGKPHKSEKDMLEMFKDRAVPYLSFTPRNDWEWVGLMQHHGALTRLLDWSRNPLVAAYFAVEKDGKNDSAVYAWRSTERPVDVKTDVHPLSITEVRKFIPAHVSERIIAQAGLFTVHPSPFAPMTSDTLEKIIIKQNFRKTMKDTLFKYGVHRAALFPGLDGLSDHLTWLNVVSH
jgi:hypothetical protein